MPRHCQSLYPRSYPSRPNPSPFTKQPKFTPVKRNGIVTRCNTDSLSKARKVNVVYDPTPYHQNWPAQIREAEATAQASTVEILIQQADVSFTFTQPATTPVAHTQPLVIIPDQTQKSPWYCAICTSAEKKCPTTFLISLKSDWSDTEEEKDFKKQTEAEEEIEDWDSNMQKQKELKEQELKTITLKLPYQAQKPCPSPHPMLMTQKHLLHSLLTL